MPCQNIVPMPTLFCLFVYYRLQLIHFWMCDVAFCSFLPIESNRLYASLMVYILVYYNWIAEISIHNFNNHFYEFIANLYRVNPYISLNQFVNELYYRYDELLCLLGYFNNEMSTFIQFVKQNFKTFGVFSVKANNRHCVLYNTHTHSQIRRRRTRSRARIMYIECNWWANKLFNMMNELHFI